MQPPEQPTPWTPPEQGYWQPGGATPPPYGPTQPTDGFSVAALVLGIVPITVGVLGIVFGILGIRRTANGQRRGRGMAIAGVVLGSIWVVLIGVGTVVSITDDSTRKDRAPVAAPHDVDIDTLKVGECINETPEEEPVTVPLVPCTQPHDGEVFAIYSLPGGKYPGDALVDRFAQGGCDKRFDTYAGAAADQSNWDVGFFGPSADLWADGDRRVFCLASHSDMSPLTGSVRA